MCINGPIRCMNLSVDDGYKSALFFATTSLLYYASPFCSTNQLTHQKKKLLFFRNSYYSFILNIIII